MNSNGLPRWELSYCRPRQAWNVQFTRRGSVITFELDGDVNGHAAGFIEVLSHQERKELIALLQQDQENPQ